MWRGKVWAFSLALAFLSLAAAPGAQAHKLLVAAVPGPEGSLQVQAFFPDGKPAQEVPVSVTPEDGGTALRGQTDSQGRCSFALLRPGPYRVEVGDPLGHRAESRVVMAGAPAGATAAVGRVGQAAPGAAAASPGAQVPREPLPWGNIFSGLAFIFGATALVMVLRVQRELRKHASRD